MFCSLPSKRVSQHSLAGLQNRETKFPGVLGGDEFTYVRCLRCSLTCGASGRLISFSPSLPFSFSNHQLPPWQNGALQNSQSFSKYLGSLSLCRNHEDCWKPGPGGPSLSVKSSSSGGSRQLQARMMAGESQDACGATGEDLTPSPGLGV